MHKIDEIKIKNVTVSDKELVDRIANDFYQVNGRKEMFAYMVNADIRTDTNAYIHYHDEYMVYYIDDVKAKDELETRFVEPETDNLISWNIDFDTYELSILYYD